MSSYATVKIHLHNEVGNIKEFCNISSKFDFNVDVTGNHYTVDAKSIMGLFALDHSKPVSITIYNYGEKTDEYLNAIRKFIVEE